MEEEGRRTRGASADVVGGVGCMKAGEIKSEEMKDRQGGGWREADGGQREACC